jgi:carboxyl-terminal processing protease
MKGSTIAGILILAFLWCSCQDLFFNPEPRDTPQENFDLLWNEFDQLYSLFEIKHINWDSLYTVYRPQVDGSTPAQLFNIMASMLSNLNDGHVYLISPFRGFAANEAAERSWKANFNFDDISGRYLKGSLRSAGAGRFIYGTVAPGIGYLLITSFEDVDFASIDAWAKEIDNVIRDLAGNKGLVVDIRNNGGGDAFNAQYIAQRFADARRLYSLGYTRNGPKHSDLSAPYEWYTSPGGPIQFTKPIVLLTNRFTASASERFTFAMKVLPYVTVMGDTTQGAMPHAVPRELPNGWTYRVTVGLVTDRNGSVYEGIGIPPDIAINISSDDSALHKDSILERAIQQLSN